MGRPGGSVGAVTNGVRDGDTHGRLSEPGACPAGEVIALAGGVDENNITLDSI